MFVGRGFSRDVKLTKSNRLKPLKSDFAVAAQALQAVRDEHSNPTSNSKFLSSSLLATILAPRTASVARACPVTHQSGRLARRFRVGAQHVEDPPSLWRAVPTSNLRIRAAIGSDGAPPARPVTGQFRTSTPVLR